MTKRKFLSLNSFILFEGSTAVLKGNLKLNIEIIEKEGYEADDILGTLAKWGQAQNINVTIVTGDRDSFQLVDKHIHVRIPRTKARKNRNRGL